jgi:TPR repeat protein
VPAGSGSQAADSDSDKESAPAEANHEQRARKPAAAKPAAAKPAAATPVDSVTEAERYIYGRGVTQECDHGLRLLKPAAEQSNVKAMISLGTLYSTGTCTPRDLPTAYRWFALALHKEPDNQALQDDLQRLWSRMTQPERQLAIRLSR